MRRQDSSEPVATDPPDADAPSAAASLIPDRDLLRALLENVPALVFTVALDGRILFVNRPHQGFTSEQLIGRSLFYYPAPPDQRRALRDAFARVVQTGDGVDYEAVLDRPPGERQWFACRLGPMRRDGHIVAVTLIATDITARKAVEDTLQESEERFRRIAEQSPDIIFRLGVNGVEYISPAFATILGRSPADRLATSVMSPQHVHPDEIPHLAEIIEQLDHGPVRCELRMLHAGGHTVWTEHHLMPILSGSGTRIAVEGIVRDITQRKRAEEELRQVHRELEERVALRTTELAHANQSLRAEIAERMRAQDQLRQHQAALAHVLRVSTMGEMAAGLAHEINQPLGAIANFANGIATRLRAGVVQPEALRDAAQQIAAEALRAGEVIRRLRDFVRRTDSKRQRCDLNGLVRDAAHLIEPDARRGGIALRLTLDRALPTVDIDAIQVEQVLFNLMRNGIEAMGGDQAPGQELLVETLRGGDNTVVVRVRDTGPGIPPDVAERIFEAFYTTKAEGLGMGLSISRSIVDDHGGRLWMQPNLDRGATFAFSLPVPSGAPAAATG